MGVPKKFLGCFKEVERVFQESFKRVSRCIGADCKFDIDTVHFYSVLLGENHKKKLVSLLG